MVDGRGTRLTPNSVEGASNTVQGGRKTAARLSQLVKGNKKASEKSIIGLLKYVCEVTEGGTLSSGSQIDLDSGGQIRALGIQLQGICSSVRSM